MPKGRRNSKNSDRKRSDTNHGDEKSDSVSDIRSLDNGSVADPSEIENSEQIVDKLKDAIDGATQKNSKGRQTVVTCLESMQKILACTFLPDVIYQTRETITECIKSSLKRGKVEEQSTAAILAVLTCIQLGPGSSSESLFAELSPVLTTSLNDESIAVKTRCKCATALALLAFMVGEMEHGTIRSLMSNFEAIFGVSRLKDDGSVPSHTLEETSLHSSCLVAWSLLLTVVCIGEVSSMAELHVKRLSELLESSDVELRIFAGETIALVCEIAREDDGNFMGRDTEDDLCSKLKELATDSRKYRAKKERKEQRCSFRDVLRSVEENEAPCIQVRFGQEVLKIDSWCRRRQYDAFCSVLGSGMNLHLAENDLLRDVFELGAPLEIDGDATLKTSKFERHMGNVAASKKRSLVRSKLRDERSEVMADYSSF